MVSRNYICNSFSTLIIQSHHTVPHTVEKDAGCKFFSDIAKGNISDSTKLLHCWGPGSVGFPFFHHAGLSLTTLTTF